jgi:hypothetical protein
MSPVMTLDLAIRPEHGVGDGDAGIDLDAEAFGLLAASQRHTGCQDCRHNSRDAQRAAASERRKPMPPFSVR